MSEKSTFRQLILEAARNADLAFGDRVKLRIILRRDPERLANEILEQAKAEGVLPDGLTLTSVGADVGAPDWEAFFLSFGDFVAKVLPLILQILPLFL